MMDVLLKARSREVIYTTLKLDEETIEHIHPESYPEQWHEELTGEAYERNVFMLGNLSLLNPGKYNKDAGIYNISFSE